MAINSTFISHTINGLAENIAEMGKNARKNGLGDAKVDKCSYFNRIKWRNTEYATRYIYIYFEGTNFYIPLIQINAHISSTISTIQINNTTIYQNLL